MNKHSTTELLLYIKCQQDNMSSTLSVRPLAASYKKTVYSIKVIKMWLKFGWGSIPGKSCSFLIVSLTKDLSLCFMCSDPHVKHWIPRGLSLASNLLLDYHVEQYRQIIFKWKLSFTYCTQKEVDNFSFRLQIL